MANEVKKFSIDPNTQIMSMDEPPEPMHSGAITLPKVRLELAKLRGRIAEATPGEKPLLELEYEIAERDAIPIFTVGRAIINALMSVLPDDQKNRIDQAKKLDFAEMATRLQRAGLDGKSAIFNHTEVETIKGRVDESYPSALVVSQIVQAFVPQEE